MESNNTIDKLKLKNGELIAANTNLINSILDLQEKNEINTISYLNESDYQSQILNLDNTIKSLKDENDNLQNQINNLSYYIDNVEYDIMQELSKDINIDNNENNYHENDLRQFFIINVLPSLIKKENEKKKNKFLLEKLMLLIKEKNYYNPIKN